MNLFVELVTFFSVCSMNPRFSNLIKKNTSGIERQGRKNQWKYDEKQTEIPTNVAIKLNT